jgi:ribosomal protein L40E
MPKGAMPPQGYQVNIEGEFRKPFRHPTFDEPGRHRVGEILPETDPKAPRHADCVDCHHPHYVSKENRFAGLRGRRVVNQVVDVVKEYEVCYRCHADSANLPGKYTNKRIEFSPTNPSYHPVEAEGKNTAVVSLIRPYIEKKVQPTDISVLSCSSCHGNDDSDGPRGVHGSRHQFILIDNYNVNDNISESQLNYALCYRCHSRNSILGNESFRFHSLHIMGTSVQHPGTSCYTCHSAHGSAEYRYLIKFNPLVVTPNSKGLLKFQEKGTSKFSGECYLSCHGVDHGPKSY